MGNQVLGNVLNPRVLVIGVFHGDEPQGECLINKYYNAKKNSNLLFVPRLNDSLTRVNKNGVDLNRNFPTKNWVLSQKDEFFGGETPASEEETCFIIGLVEKYNPKLILTLHAPFKIVNYDGNQDWGIKLVNQISEIIGYPVEPSIGYPTPGSFGTWAGLEKEIFTITLELDEDVCLEALEAPVFKIFELLEGI